MNKEIKSKKRYEIVWDDYIIPVKWLPPKRLSIVDADKLFKAFSKHWSDLSSEEMLQEFWMEVGTWHAIKSALRLYKHSHIVSPHSYENASEEQKDIIAEEAIGVHFDSMRSKMVTAHEKKFTSEARKAMADIATIDAILEHISVYIEQHKPIDIPFTRTSTTR